MNIIDEFKNQIHCESWENIIPYLPDGSIQLVFTSPPYEDMKKYRDKEGNIITGGLKGDDFIDFYWSKMFSLLKPKMKETGIVVINVNDKSHNFRKLLTNYKGMIRVCEEGWFLVEHVAWFKTRGIGRNPEYALQDWWEHCYVFAKDEKYIDKYYPSRLRGKYSDRTIQRYGMPDDPKITKVRKIGSSASRLKSEQSRELEEHDDKDHLELNEEGKLLPNVLVCSPDGRRHLKHEARFPLDLARYFIVLCSDMGDIVYDPMCGCGTTCCMARYLERNFIGSDIIQDNVDMAREEVEKYYPQIEMFSEFDKNQMQIEV